MLPLFETGALRVPIAETYPSRRRRRPTTGSGRAASSARSCFLCRGARARRTDAPLRRRGGPGRAHVLRFARPGVRFRGSQRGRQDDRDAHRPRRPVRRRRLGPVGGQARWTRPCAPGSATCRRSAACTRRCASRSSSRTSRGCTVRTPRPRPRGARLDGAGRRANRGGRPRGAALAGEPAAGAARHRARPRPDRARPRRAVQRPGPRRRRRHERGARRRAREAGVPVLFSSHQLELVERLCDAVAIIKDGGLVASGTVAELRARGAAQALWRVEVQGAASGWAAAAGFDVRSEDGDVTLVDGAGRAGAAGRGARRRRASRASSRSPPRWPSSSARRRPTSSASSPLAAIEAA